MKFEITNQFLSDGSKAYNVSATDSEGRTVTVYPAQDLKDAETVCMALNDALALGKLAGHY